MTPGLAIVLPVATAALHAAYGLAEVALAKASPPGLEAKAGLGDRGAAAAIEQNADENRLLAAGLVGSSLVGTIGVALSFEAGRGYGAPAAGVATYIVLLALIDAALPRLIGPDVAMTLAGPAARLVWITQLALFPVVRGLEIWARAVCRAAGSTRTTALTRQEIVLVLDRGHGMDPQETAMIRRVLALPDTKASACMTPIAEVDVVSAEGTVAEAAAIAIRTGRSRFAVVGPSLDPAVALVGVVHARDLLFAPDDTLPVRTRMRPIRRMLAAKPAHEVAQELRRARSVMAALVDDDGRVVGIVTIEDLLEEIVGEIHDERDRTAPPPPLRT